MTSLPPAKVVLASETLNSAQRRFYLPFAHTFVLAGNTYVSRQKRTPTNSLQKELGYRTDQEKRDDDKTKLAVRTHA